MSSSHDHYSENLIAELKIKDNLDLRHQLHNLSKDLASARIGLRNIVITYRNDETFMAKLDICIDAFVVRTNKNMNFDSKL